MVAKDASALERGLGDLVAQSERAEDEAVAKAAAAAEKRLEALTDPARIAKLKDQIRGANGRINKVIYRLYEAEKAGLDPAKVLSSALDRSGGYTAQGKRLTMENLLANYGAAKRVNAFTPDNLKRLRLGKTAVLDENGVKLDIDHIVAAATSDELRTTLANLRLTPSAVNRMAQDVVTGGALDYAEALHEAGLLSADGLAKVRQAFLQGRYK